MWVLVFDSSCSSRDADRDSGCIGNYEPSGREGEERGFKGKTGSSGAKLQLGTVLSIQPRDGLAVATIHGSILEGLVKAKYSIGAVLPIRERAVAATATVVVVVLAALSVDRDLGSWLLLLLCLWTVALAAAGCYGCCCSACG
ncbi:hypothetical protein TEA_020208 [Camellia sinensis var. sinensis]|uniref:Uncharacterized protein n=1 Tax=Camellia sinensis var. sinensis TaxID=542762 RepID=A0A4S4E049_CAMSN|nr:hypothetical protein TEA_020208 [Camellia sinensis var. sinensis]